MITISADIAPKLLEWFQGGRGVIRWENQEIASGHAREVFTPGDNPEKPNWRYGNPSSISRDDIQVETFTVLKQWRGRFKAHYYGPGINRETERKAKRLCAKYKLPEDSWRWFHDDMPGYVQVQVGRIELQSFRDWEASLSNSN